MCLLEEPNAAGDLIGDTAPRKLQLQLNRVIMRAIKHGDVAQIDLFIAQFENSLRDKLRLLSPVVERDQGRLDRV